MKRRLFLAVLWVGLAACSTSAATAPATSAPARATAAAATTRASTPTMSMSPSEMAAMSKSASPAASTAAAAATAGAPVAATSGPAATTPATAPTTAAPTAAPATAAPTAATAPAGGGTTVAVTLVDTAIRLSTSSVVAGTVTFNVTNGGSTPHEFVVLQTSMAQNALPADPANPATVMEPGFLGKVANLQPKTSGTLTLTLAAGSYVFICNEPAHYSALGMHIGFSVR